jgi:putative ABC transport system permease protein
MALRPVLRSLVARPAYAAVVSVTVALVVGPCAAVLAVLNATMIRPLPFADPERLVQVFTLPPHVSGVGNLNPLASLDFVRFRDHLTLADLAGQWARERALGGQGDPVSVPTLAVSANLFRVLGASPLRGRTFTEDEDRRGANLIVLSYGLWQRRFGGQEGVLGTRVTLDREDFEIIGVMGPDFNSNYVPSDLWTPLGLHEGNLIRPGATFVQTVVRLRAGVTLDQFRAQLTPLMDAVGKESAASRGGWTVVVLTLREAQFGQTAPAVWTLLGGVLVLALMATANLTNLTIAEAATRQGDALLRRALGARRWDLLHLALVESLLLCAVGGGLGLLLATLSLPMMLALDPTTAAPLGRVTVDWHVQLAAWALALGVCLVASTLPQLVTSRGDLGRALAGGSRRTTGSRASQRVRAALVALETLLAVVLLACGALLLAAFGENSRTNPGFDAGHVLGGQLRLSATALPTSEARTRFVETVLDRLRATPGIVDASTTQNLFLPGFASVTLVMIDGRPSPDGQPYTAQFRRTSPGYFRTMRIPELGGRTFERRDDATAPLVAVVSHLFATQYWPGEDAVGRRLRWSGKLVTVIGVVGDVSDVGLGQPPAPTLYLAYAQSNNAFASVGLVVRTTGSPTDLASTVARVVHEVDPAQPLSSVTTLDQFLGDSLGPARFRGMLLACFSLIGVLLAAVGVYGVTSRGVSERTRELGVRLALGGQPSEIRNLVLAQAVGTVAVGIVLGGPATWLAIAALRHGIAGLEVSAAGPVTGAFVTLAVAGLVAAGGPALRAARVDPLTALRAD